MKRSKGMGTRDWGLGAGKHYILSCTPPLAGRSKFKEKKGFPPLCLLAHPRFLGVGGERSETEGGGFRRKLKNGAQ